MLDISVQFYVHEWTQNLGKFWAWVHLDGASVWSWSINELKSDRFQTTAFCWTKCQKQRCYETWNMTSRETLSFNPQWGKKLIFRMVKVHQMHHVGAIEKHMNITSDLILPLPQAGFHLMWFSDLPEYADATRRSFHEKGRNLQRRKTTTGKWLGWCFPCQFVFVFFFWGGGMFNGLGWDDFQRMIDRNLNMNEHDIMPGGWRSVMKLKRCHCHVF